MYGTPVIASPACRNFSQSPNSQAAASTTDGSDQTVERGPTCTPQVADGLVQVSTPRVNTNRELHVRRAVSSLEIARDCISRLKNIQISNQLNGNNLR